jgi:nucleoside-diphosphate-sugar epimerase
MGTRNVVNAALEQRVRRFCHVSSVAALGVPPDMPYAADENYQGAGTDNTRYGCSKEGSEKEVMRGMAEGLNAFIVNPSVILGMACGAKGTTSLFRKLYRGILFYPNGSNGFVDVWDVVRAMIILMNSPISGERFILNGVNIRFQDLFREVSELFGKKAPRIRITRAMTEIAWRADWVISKVTGGKPLLPKETAMASLGNYSYSAGKICRMTGFKFTEFHQTLVRYATFYAQEFAAQSGRIKARENDFDLSNLFRMSFDGHGTLNTQH